VAKYDPLRYYLAGLSSRQHEVTLGFEQINAILRTKLPQSGYEHTAFWHGSADASPTHVQKRAWSEAGWSVRSVDIASMRVTFERPKG
jgi:hypothetical protein